jgi:SAM-dependent methyltransferase
MLAMNHSHSSRTGARQPRRFDPARASKLDDPDRFSYLPPKAVLELLDIPPGGCIVDYGTGTGTYAIAIARLRPDLRIVALDEQPEMLGLLRAKLEAEPAPNVEPFCTAQHPFGERADRVLAINVLHEAGDAALGEIRALLDEDGSALFIDWNAEVERPVGPPRDHVYSPAEARARLEQSGFRVSAERNFRYHYAMLATSVRESPARRDG